MNGFGFSFLFLSLSWGFNDHWRSLRISIEQKITFLSDAGMDRQVVKGRQALQELLEGRRTGKSEWSRSYDSIALLGLQLHDPSWCFHSIANQRTVDRVEIGMLGVLSRSLLYNEDILIVKINFKYNDANWLVQESPKRKTEMITCWY